MKEIKQFYDKLASSYDNMTSFDKRFKKEDKHFKSIVDKHKIFSALDAGAGTGFHSLLLASLGVDVTAVDISNKMLRQAKKHASEMQLKIRTVQSDFLSIPKSIDAKFDAIFCLGNSLPHLSLKALHKTFKIFFRMLHPGGIIISQILNYNRILHGEERIQNVRHSETFTSIRYYDFHKRTFRFNILTIHHPVNRRSTHTFNSILHYPIYQENLSEIVSKSGFIRQQSYGGIDLSGYRADSSQDIVLIAKKP
jgi:glycine/sarcosine N-methyltransferase